MNNRYKDYQIVSGESSKEHLVSPNGVRIVGIQNYYGSDPPDYHSLVDGLQCNAQYGTHEHMIRDVVPKYERLTKPWWERFSGNLFRNFMSLLFGTIIRAVITIIVTILVGTFLAAWLGIGSTEMITKPNR
ncbi:MAG: hypothetical protein OXH52_23235 [Gammaproteobacteria bacterium]|nr:hypothetical protein [Gammaproteobacteria bacterium]